MASHLTDMEELLAKIVLPNARDYMSESLSCYQAGAFRACVVLSYIALFDDLRSKLAPLSLVNTIAKNIHRDIEKKAKDQEVYESFLSEQLASSSLISAAQKTRLDIIIKLRNKAAHPSGIHASAEEARYVFFETIDKFLSQAQLQTTHAVDALLEALPQGNFFPTNQTSDFRAIVESEISYLHVSSYPYLMKKLVEMFDSEHEASKYPAAKFLLGLAVMKKDQLRKELRQSIVVGKAQVKTYAPLIVSLLRLDPQLLDGLSNIQKSRVTALLILVLDETNRVTPFTRLANPIAWLGVAIQDRGQESIWIDFKTFVEALLDKYLNDTEFIKAVTEAGPIRDAFFALLETRASSNHFETANTAAKTVVAIEGIYGDGITPLNAFRLLTAVTSAAGHGAWDAAALKNNVFKGVPSLKAQATQFAAEWGGDAAEIVGEFGLSYSLPEFSKILSA